MAHWLALMANLRVAENSSASFDGSLARSPSLIVLHEPSSLLLHDRSKYAGIQGSMMFADLWAAVLCKVQFILLLCLSDKRAVCVLFIIRPNTVNYIASQSASKHLLILKCSLKYASSCFI